MSSGLSVDAIPRMIGLLRWPALNSASCLTRYSACCPWMMGLAGTPLEPSFVWQATQTPFEIASPLARSGLALAALAAASAAKAGAAPTRPDSRDDSRRATGFMTWDVSYAKPNDFTIMVSKSPMARQNNPEIQPAAAPSPLAVEERRALGWTHTARFLTTASRLDQLPATELTEIAFVGHSN